MGKERFIEAGSAGLRSTVEYVSNKPKTILLGTAGLGGALSGSSLGMSIVYGDVKWITINSIIFFVDAGLATLALTKLKNSKSGHQQSHSPSTREN